MHQYRYDKLAALRMQDSIWLTTVAAADVNVHAASGPMRGVAGFRVR